MKNYILSLIGLLLFCTCQNPSSTEPSKEDIAAINAIKKQIEQYKNKEVIKDWMMLIDIAQAVREASSDLGEKSPNSSEHQQATAIFSMIKGADSKMTDWAGEYDINVLKEGSSPSKTYLIAKKEELKEIDSKIEEALLKGRGFLTENGLEIPDTFKAPEIDKDKEPDFRVTRKIDKN